MFRIKRAVSRRQTSEVKSKEMGEVGSTTRRMRKLGWLEGGGLGLNAIVSTDIIVGSFLLNIQQTNTTFKYFILKV